MSYKYLVLVKKYDIIQRYISLNFEIIRVLTVINVNSMDFISSFSMYLYTHIEYLCGTTFSVALTNMVLFELIVIR